MVEKIDQVFILEFPNSIHGSKGTQIMTLILDPADYYLRNWGEEIIYLVFIVCWRQSNVICDILINKKWGWYLAFLILLHTPSFLLEIRVTIKISK